MRSAYLHMVRVARPLKPISLSAVSNDINNQSNGLLKNNTLLNFPFSTLRDEALWGKTTPDSNLYFVEKEMFISAVIASDRTQLQSASPAINTWRRLNPNRNGASPTGMRELASNCGDIHVDLTLLGLNWALTLKWNVFPPNPVRQDAENVLK
jgi:hypothetical protein